jgi:Glycosyl transferase family 90
MIVVLLVVAVLNELYKAFQTTEYFHDKDRPRFSAMTDFELRIHLEAGLPVYKHHSSGFDSAGTKPRRPFDADAAENIPQRSVTFSNGRSTDMVAMEPDIETADNAEEGDGEDERLRSKAERGRRNLDFAYQTRGEMLARSERFPSVQERVKLYMSNWYTPPCDQSAAVMYDYTPYNATLNFVRLREIVLTREQEQTRLFQINSFFHGSSMSGSFDQVHFMDREAMMECEHRYCKDVVEFLLPALDRVVADGAISSTPPILYQFGDDNRTKAMRAPVSSSSSPLPSSSPDSPAIKSSRRTDRYPNMPVFKKIRKSIRRAELERLTDSHTCYKRDKRIIPEYYHLEPIVFKLKTQRHFGRIHDLAEVDIPWQAKKNVAIFRGEMNGNYPVDYVTSGTIEQHTVHQRCRLLERCWLVYQHAARRSPLVDAKITLPYIRNNSKKIPRYLDRNPDASSVEDDDSAQDKESDNESDDEIADDDVDLYGEKVLLEDMLQYKALIMLEGNDVSSGLKWALFSNSVVLMPEPTLVSWAMEERLEPWVHYIPINVYKDGFGSKKSTAALTDVEEKMQWILDHDDEAQQIARAGKLWIADLVLHPDVAMDEAAIFDEMMRRYAVHFVRDGASVTESL